MSSASTSFIATLDSIFIPKTVKEALSNPGWYNAMLDEIRALDENQTWALVDLLPDKKVVRYKWVFEVKVNPYGSIAWLKAHLVVKGYAQTYGVDDFDTFSTVAKLPMFACLFPLLSLKSGLCISWTSRMPFIMVISTNKFTWSNHMGLLLMGSPGEYVT